MSAAPAKFAAVFGIAGLVLSLLFSLFSGNSVFHIVLVVVVCAAVAAGLGAGVCFVLQSQVPELFETFSGLGGVTTSRPAPRYEPEDSGLPQPGTSAATGAAASDEEVPLEHETVAAAISSMGQAGQGPERTAGNPKHFGDHIIVDKVKIKNEPRLMAQAIRTLLTKDD